MVEGKSGGWVSFTTHAVGGYPASSKCESCKLFKYVEGAMWQEYQCHRMQGNPPGYAAYEQIRKERGRNGNVIAVPSPTCSQYEPGSGDETPAKKSYGGGLGASGGENIMSGMSQLVNADWQNADVGNIAAGAGKVGLGAAKLAGKGVVTGVKFAVEETKRRMAFKKEYDAYMNQLNAYIMPGNSEAIAQSLPDLFSIIVWNSEVSPDGVREVRDIAGEKIENGILKLRELGDTANADYFQQSLNATEWGIAKIKAARRKEIIDAIIAKTLAVLKKIGSVIAAGVKFIAGKIKKKP